MTFITLTLNPLQSSANFRLWMQPEIKNKHLEVNAWYVNENFNSQTLTWRRLRTGSAYRYTCSRLFKEFTGIGFKDYQRQTHGACQGPPSFHQ